jgi:hypothetical protein
MSSLAARARQNSAPHRQRTKIPRYHRKPRLLVWRKFKPDTLGVNGWRARTAIAWFRITQDCRPSMLPSSPVGLFCLSMQPRIVMAQRIDIGAFPTFGAARRAAAIYGMLP